MSSQKEVVIVGAGVVGCSIAYHLAKQGVASEVIERDAIAARASGKSWAVWTYPPLILSMESQRLDELFSMPEGSIRPWLELFWLGYHRLPDEALGLKEKAGIDIGYSEFTYTNVALSENAEKALKAILSSMRSQGYHEGGWLAADDLRAIFPDISPRAVGGLSTPGLQVEPYEYTLSLAQAAEKMGASFRSGETVGFRHKGSKVTSVILASGTEIKADVVVLAAGPWSGQSSSRLGREMPITINREQCLRVEVPQQLPPYGLSTSRVMVLPKANGTVILGNAGVADPQPGFDSSLTEEAKTQLLDAAIELLPRLQEAKLVEHRGDLEGWSPPPNHIQPVLGRLPEWDNAYIAARMGTMGMMLSLGVGRVMADLIIRGGRPSDRTRTMMEFLSPARLPDSEGS